MASFGAKISLSLYKSFQCQFLRLCSSAVCSTTPFLRPRISTSISVPSSYRTFTMEAKLTVDSPPDVITKKSRLLHPPPNPGMKILDKSAFTKKINVPIFIVSENNVPLFAKVLKPFYLKLRKFKPIQEDTSQPGLRKLYFNPELVANMSEFLDSLPAEQKSLVISTTNETISLCYENWSWDQILDSVIPDDTEKVGSFTAVGHVLHLNLRDQLLPYKHIIGQVLLDNVNQAKTIVNKIQTIHNTYRNFQMEVIAGEPNTIVKVKENNVEFEFDFATVYWNSRLSAEHERIIKGYLKSGDILFDVFAGVGPFAIPAGKKKCFVYANDLNPESYRWLQHNVKKRKVEPYVKTFNEDGRDFILNHFPELITISSDSESMNCNLTGKIHITMNLPAMAVEFLDSFWGLVNNEDVLNKSLKIIVHVYCFVKGLAEEDLPKMALGLVKEKLRYDLTDENVLEVFFVRNVAPNKNMYRISFTLPPEILSSKCPSSLSSSHQSHTCENSDDINGAETESNSKKLKLDLDQI